MFPNAINPVGTGLIPVAILTTDTFDATTSGSRSRPLGDDWLGIWSIEESVVFRCTNWYKISVRSRALLIRLLQPVKNLNILAESRMNQSNLEVWDIIWLGVFLEAAKHLSCLVRAWLPCLDVVGFGGMQISPGRGFTPAPRRGARRREVLPRRSVRTVSGDW
jgi:hypothetical protein